MKSTVTLLYLVGVALCLPIAASENEVRSGKDVVLVDVNGSSLTLSNLEQKHAAALFQARTAYYEAERKVIEEFVDDYLLEQQAKKEGVSVSALIEKHVTATLPKDPSDEALHVYYEGVDTAEPYEAVRAKIVDALRQRRMAKARSAYLQTLRAQATIITHLAPPRAPISMKDVPTRGSGKPPVTVVEFADYECPYCQQMEPVVEKLASEFNGKIAFAFKDFPLSMHPDAQKAAEASHCAGAQGKYWEYHDMLFAKKQLDPLALKAAAAELKLDAAAFSTCLDTGQMAPFVKEEAAEAMGLGLQGTPTVLVNGRNVSGAPTYERIRAVIMEELSAVSAAASAEAAAARGAMEERHVIP